MEEKSLSLPKSKEEFLAHVEKLSYDERVQYASRLGRDNKSSAELKKLIEQLRTVQWVFIDLFQSIQNQHDPKLKSMMTLPNFSPPKKETLQNSYMKTNWPLQWPQLRRLIWT